MAIIVPVVILGILAIFSAIFFPIFFIRRRAKSKKTKQDSITQYNALPMQIYKSAQHYVTFSSINLLTELGAGSFGKVFKAEWNKTIVAVKMCNQTTSLDDFVKEADLMASIPPHPNVLRMLAVSNDGKIPVLVLEFCDQGSLDNILFEREILSVEKQLELLLGIARGILHLHKNNIVHRDLAARNILLHRGEPKISVSTRIFC